MSPILGARTLRAPRPAPPPREGGDGGLPALVHQESLAARYARLAHRGFEPRRIDLVLRGLDVAIAAAALTLLAPVIVALAVAVRLGSGSPVLYRGKRVGRAGRLFTMYKFRTLTPDAELRLGPYLGEELTRRTEAELTPVGRFLRATQLDELPQLVNVARGEMSLVGPRPLVLAEDRYVKGWDRRRLYIKPGMTGPWQILGSTRIPLYEMVKMDYLYVANWSLWGDLKVLLRTALYIFARRNV